GPPAVTVPVDVAVAPVVLPPRRQQMSRQILVGLGVVGFALLVAMVAPRVRAIAGAKSNAVSGTNATPVVAIGKIAAFGPDSGSANLAAPLADLLTTSIARVRGIHVVSHGRMLELMRLAGTLSDT